MRVFFNKLLMDILIWILRLLDDIFELFRLLTGIDKVTLSDTGESISIVDYFLQAEVVTQVFWSLFIVSIFIVAISILVSVIKNFFNLKGGERKPHSRTVGQGIIAIFTSIAMAGVMIIGVGVANEVLVYVNKSFNQTTQATSISEIVFEMSVQQTYEIDTDNSKTDAEGNYTHIVYLETKVSGWINGKSIADLDLDNMTADDIFGTFSKWFGFENEGGRRTGGLIDLNSFNFLIGYFGAIILIVALCTTMLGLVKRLYDLVLLFLALPLISGTIPLDDGAYFKLWRETVISKVILAYGAVFSVNVFLIVVPMINNINISGMGLVGDIFKLFLIVGAGLSISGGQLLFARLFGTSAEESREMMQGARTLMAGGAAAAGIAGGVKRAIFGGTNRYGKTTDGTLGKVGNIAKGGANAVGNFLGGNAYRSWANSNQAKQTALTSALRGSVSSSAPSTNKFMQGGGLIGAGVNALRRARNNKLTEKNKELAEFAREQLDKGVMVMPSNLEGFRGKRKSDSEEGDK